jgi:hypothetical protein
MASCYSLLAKTKPDRSLRPLRLGVIIFLLGVVGCGGSSSPASPTPPSSPTTNQISIGVGCYSSSYQSISQGNRNLLGCGLLSSFGDASFDGAFAAESNLQDQFWGFVVPVAAFDECAGRMNALSLPSGFILFGRNLAVDVLTKTGSDVGIVAALAHEYAHQVQFRFGWMRPWESTIRTTELEADAFAGYYMAAIKDIDSAALDAYFQALGSFGDYAFNSPNHHGTPINRMAAGAYGMLAALDAQDHNRTPTYEELHQAFVGAITGAEAANWLLSSPQTRAKVTSRSGGTPVYLPSRSSSMRIAVPGSHFFPKH